MGRGELYGFDDLVLTWKDMEAIERIAGEVRSEYLSLSRLVDPPRWIFSNEIFYGEVLKRFKKERDWPL